MALNPEFKKQLGNITKESFHPGRTRYHYDFRSCGPGTGWKQYDTHQDASWFGVWVHPEKRQILTFAEGDEVLTICFSDEKFKEELEKMAEFYGPPPPAFVVFYPEKGVAIKYFDTRPAAN